VKAFRLAFSTKFKEDYAYWQGHDLKKCDKIDALINDAHTNPFKGIGKPEPLTHDLKGLWSRRITKEHRLVYRVDSDLITFLQCRFHYDK
jgi:toxin YoeB